LLGLSELCVFPLVLFFTGLELVTGLVLGGEVRDLLVVRLPKILIVMHNKVGIQTFGQEEDIFCTGS
jgi:hypothetical protein